jgi:hypothetical protein
MRRALQLLLLEFLLFGCIGLIYLANVNNQLTTEVNRLEAELGRMTIQDPDRIHIIAIEDPEVPPEVASEVDRVWQFRCYLPARYSFLEMNGSGRVAKKGVYLSDGYGSSYRFPRSGSIHNVLTMSIKKRGDEITVFSSFRGLGSYGIICSGFTSERFEDLVVDTLVENNQDSRSFDQQTILPLLRFYNPATAKDEQVAGKPLTTYRGGLILICPKSLEAKVEQLRSGEVPEGFEPGWIASGEANE